MSRQEFESLKYDLHYWQNVTLTIIKNNIANQIGKSHKLCPPNTSSCYITFVEEDQDCKALQEEVKSLKECFNATLEEILSTISEDNECIFANFIALITLVRVHIYAPADFVSDS